MELPELTNEERERYEWQMWTPGFGELGQRQLKNTTVLVSRVGGVGGTAALALAAAGVGRLILAHAGNVRRNDLNRQLLMTTEALDQPRIKSAEAQIRALNPNVAVETVSENISEANVAKLVARCDIVLSAAPLFEERLLLNREAVKQKKPIVDGAMYDMEGRLTTVIPEQTACLACWCPEAPSYWKRQFPVFGAVASTMGSLAATEVIKLAGSFAEPLSGLLVLDLRDMSFRTVAIARRDNCAVCSATH